MKLRKKISKKGAAKKGAAKKGAAKKGAAKKGAAKKGAAKKGAKKAKASGARIRELLIVGKLDTAGILEVIHREFSDSKAVGSDVSWNRWMLKSYPEKYDKKTGDSIRAR